MTLYVPASAYFENSFSGHTSFNHNLYVDLITPLNSDQTIESPFKYHSKRFKHALHPNTTINFVQDTNLFFESVNKLRTILYAWDQGQSINICAGLNGAQVNQHFSMFAEQLSQLCESTREQNPLFWTKNIIDGESRLAFDDLQLAKKQSLKRYPFVRNKDHFFFTYMSDHGC